MFGEDTAPDDYIRGPGAPALTLPLTTDLVWGNQNRVQNSAFRYNSHNEIQFELSGQNNVSNVTNIGILEGPSLLEYEPCDILDLIKRLNSNNGGPDTFGMVVQTATSAFTTTNGVNISIGESYIEFPNGDTWDAPAAPILPQTISIVP